MPEVLRGKRVMTIDIFFSCRCSTQGSFEKRLKDIIKEVQDSKGQNYFIY